MNIRVPYLMECQLRKRLEVLPMNRSRSAVRNAQLNSRGDSLEVAIELLR